MNIAVLSLTRDRLSYTRHCFSILEELAGCEYDHYVLDQGSDDGTREWLAGQQHLNVMQLDENVGVNRGLNLLLDWLDPAGYDVIVKFDNDCELLTANTLADLAEYVAYRDLLLSPRIHGLRNPPHTVATVGVGDATVEVTPVIGGIFIAAPAWVFAGSGYRHNENAPLWGDDDSSLCAWFRGQGGIVGYVQGYNANHYETTDGQHAAYPWYFDRRVLEGGPA